MKKVHYRNIGFPKTGTTWLGIQLSRNPFIDARISQNFKEFRPDTFTEYKSLYEKYDVSFNLDPNAFVFQFDKDHYLRPENMHTYATHISIIFRNPYELLNSMYNFARNTKINPGFKKESYLDVDGYIFQNYINMLRFFNYWSKCKLPIKYLFYDDMRDDPKKFVHDVCSYIGIPGYYRDINFILKTEINDPLVIDDGKLIDYINDSISLIEEKTKRDLSGWKK